MAVLNSGTKLLYAIIPFVILDKLDTKWKLLREIPLDSGTFTIFKLEFSSLGTPKRRGTRCSSPDCNFSPTYYNWQKTKKTNTKNDICLNRLNYFCSGENHCRNDGVYFVVDNNEKRGKSYDFLISQIDTSNLSGYLLFIFSFFWD